MKELLEELAHIREVGYALDNEELAYGVRCIAAPIFSYGGRVDYSLGLSGPTANITNSNIGAYIERIVKICNTISEELGYNYVAAKLKYMR
jgi:DNA-binding IclR family transcriptional regulator